MLSTNDLDGNRFINAAAGVLVEMVTVIVCWFTVELTDRRKTYMMASLVTAMGIALAPFISLSKTSYTEF